MFIIKKNMPEPNVPTTIRFTESLFEELKSVATKNGVSFNALVLQCCCYALDEMAEEIVAGD